MLLDEPALLGPLQHHRQRLRGRHVVAGRRVVRVRLDGGLSVEDARDLSRVGRLGHAPAHRP